jgi:hypothetical protein
MMILDRATPDELDRRAARQCGWKARLLRELATQARTKEPVEIELTARRM